jgi:hypothetical protein
MTAYKSFLDNNLEQIRSLILLKTSTPADEIESFIWEACHAIKNWEKWTTEELCNIIARKARFLFVDERRKSVSIDAPGIDPRRRKVTVRKEECIPDNDAVYYSSPLKTIEWEETKEILRKNASDNENRQLAIENFLISCADGSGFTVSEAWARSGKPCSYNRFSAIVRDKITRNAVLKATGKTHGQANGNSIRSTNGSSTNRRNARR